MPMDTFTCPHYGADDQAARDGHNRSGTLQRKEHGHGSALHEQAVRLSLEGMSLRATSRLLGVVHQSVANWVSAAAAELPTRVSDPTPTETVEVDELYTFIVRRHCPPVSKLSPPVQRFGTLIVVAIRTGQGGWRCDGSFL